MSLRWYVVHAYSNFEHGSRSRSKSGQARRTGAKFGEILVPTEEVVEMRDGQKRKSDRKFFPGYVLVQMEMDEDTWHLVREVPKVLGFIGGTSDKPAPSPTRKRCRFCAASKKAWTSRSRRCCSSPAKWCA
jgi:transcriptional antiterminator NusG